MKEPLLGFRIWSLSHPPVSWEGKETEVPLRLESWVHGCEWPPDKPVCARDILGDPVRPTFDNGYGFHAFHSWNRSNAYSPRLDGTVSQWSSLGLVSGLMLGWGQTCVFARGFRSEWARVACFVYEGEAIPSGLRDLAANYSVPVMRTPDAAISYGQEWGREYKAAAAA